MAQKREEEWETIVRKIRETEEREKRTSEDLKFLRDATAKNLLKRSLRLCKWLRGEESIPDDWEDVVTGHVASVKYILGEGE